MPFAGVWEELGCQTCRSFWRRTSLSRTCEAPWHPGQGRGKRRSDPLAAPAPPSRRAGKSQGHPLAGGVVEGSVRQGGSLEPACLRPLD